jgi:hypothetical protein
VGLDEDQVVAHGRRVGGTFGGKTICTVELEAALPARAVRAPVKVQWTRAQEFQFGVHRPRSSHRLRASLKDVGCTPVGMPLPPATSCSPMQCCRRGCNARPTWSATMAWRVVPRCPVARARGAPKSMSCACPS